MPGRSPTLHALAPNPRLFYPTIAALHPYSNVSSLTFDPSPDRVTQEDPKDSVQCCIYLDTVSTPTDTILFDDCGPDAVFAANFNFQTPAIAAAGDAVTFFNIHITPFLHTCDTLVTSL